MPSRPEMFHRQCRDCGQIHDTGLDALRCDWRIGGEPHVRAVLAGHAVHPDRIDAIVETLILEEDNP